MDHSGDLAPFSPDEYYSFKLQTSALGSGSGIIDAFEKSEERSLLQRPSFLLR